MGLRGIQVPANAQPQDLSSPINSRELMMSDLGDTRIPQQPQQAEQTQSQEETPIGEILGGLPNKTMAPQAPEQPSEMPKPRDPELDRMVDKAITSVQAKDPFLEEANRELASEDWDDFQNEVDEAESLFSGFEDDTEVKQIDPIIKALAGIPKTSEGRLSFLKKQFGAENVEYDEDGDTFLVNTPEGMRTLGDGAFDIADVLNSSGDLIEGAAAVAGSVAAGTAVRSVFMPGPAALVNLAVGAGAAGTASLLRSLITEKGMKVEEAQDFVAANEALNEAGIDLALGAGFMGLGKGVKFLKGALANTNVAKADKAVTIRLALEKEKSMLQVPEMMAGKGVEVPYISTEMMADRAFGAIQSWERYLSGRVGMVKEKAFQRATESGKRFSPKKTIAKLDNILEPYTEVDAKTGLRSLKSKVQFSGKRGSNTPIDYSEDLTEGFPQGVLDDIEKNIQDVASEEEFGAAIRAAKARNSQLKAAQISAFGGPQNAPALRDMLERYNTLVEIDKNGGMPLKDLDNQVMAIGQLKNGIFEKGAGDKMTPQLLQAYQGLYSTASLERTTIMKEVLSGTVDGKVIDDALVKFSQNAERIGDIMARVNKNPKQFLDSIMQPKNSKAVNDFLDIVGRDSAQADKLRSYFISDAINKSIDPAKPVFNGDQFLKEVDPRKWEGSLTSLFDTPQRMAQVNRLRFIAKQAQKVQINDSFWRSDAGEKTLDTLIPSFAWTSPIAWARSVFRFARVNPDMSYFLSKEGLTKMAADNRFQASSEMVRQGIDIFSAMVDASRVVNVAGKKAFAQAEKSGVKKILVPTTKEAFRSAIRLGAVPGSGTDYGNEAMAFRDIAEGQAAAPPSEPEYAPFDPESEEPVLTPQED